MVGDSGLMKTFNTLEFPTTSLTDSFKEGDKLDKFMEDEIIHGKRSSWMNILPPVIEVKGMEGISLHLIVVFLINDALLYIFIYEHSAHFSSFSTSSKILKLFFKRLAILSSSCHLQM